MDKLVSEEQTRTFRIYSQAIYMVAELAKAWTPSSMNKDDVYPFFLNYTPDPEILSAAAVLWLMYLAEVTRRNNG
jgi:hypothetical protein